MIKVGERNFLFFLFITLTLSCLGDNDRADPGLLWPTWSITEVGSDQQTACMPPSQSSLPISPLKAASFACLPGRAPTWTSTRAHKAQQGT